MAYFPSMYNQVQHRVGQELIKRRVLAVLDQVIKNELSDDKIDSIDKAILAQVHVPTLSGRDSEELKYDSNFEELSLLISTKTLGRAKDMTVLEYYTAYNKIKKDNKHGN